MKVAMGNKFFKEFIFWAINEMVNYGWVTCNAYRSLKKTKTIYQKNIYIHICAHGDDLSEKCGFSY